MPEETLKQQENEENKIQTEELDEQDLEQVSGGVAGSPFSGVNGHADKTVQSYQKIEIEY